MPASVCIRGGMRHPRVLFYYILFLGCDILWWYQSLGLTDR
jgi:hypothetical protein